MLDKFGEIGWIRNGPLIIENVLVEIMLFYYREGVSLFGGIREDFCAEGHIDNRCENWYNSKQAGF